MSARHIVACSSGPWLVAAGHMMLWGVREYGSEAASSGQDTYAGAGEVLASGRAGRGGGATALRGMLLHGRKACWHMLLRAVSPSWVLENPAVE